MSELAGILKAVLGSDAGAFGVVVAALWGVVAVTRKIERILADHDALGKSVEKIETGLAQIGQDLMYIKAELRVRNTSSAGALLQAQSPVSLTDKGKAAADAIDASGILAESWESRIRPAIASAAPSGAAYDVQQFCLERMPVEPEKFFSPGAIDRMKRFAFEHGVSLFEVASVVGILARDKYLAAVGAEAAPRA